ncbi:hypothetical protein [Mycobacterium tuberculosis]|nr:hypothetical protein [Mycobacterium tuberculosis]
MIAHHGVVLAGRLEVLADGQEIDLGRAQVVHHLETSATRSNISDAL